MNIRVTAALTCAIGVSCFAQSVQAQSTSNDTTVPSLPISGNGERRSLESYPSIGLGKMPSTSQRRSTHSIDSPDQPIQLLPMAWELNNHQSSFNEKTFCADPNNVCRTSVGWLDEFAGLLAFDGSKQPQDFGVNANAGLQASMNWGLPILRDWGIGAQVGTNLCATQNAVRVYELLGESRSRTQNFTTLGAFQRLDNGIAWGGVYDFLYEDSYDNFCLGQWRLRGSYDFFECNQVGITTQLRAFSDDGIFGANTPVTLRPINQGSVYWRRFWETGAQTTGWIGIADGHGENNAVTGPSLAKSDSVLFGADILMPLTTSFAIYGETNMITPFDTGTVDAFLGLQWYPGGNAFRARRGKYSPLLPTASPTSFSTDLDQ